MSETSETSNLSNLSNLSEMSGASVVDGLSKTTFELSKNGRIATAS